MADSITPPMELLKHWEDQHFDEGENYDVMLTQAYQTGADQELEACCELLQQKGVPAWSLLRLHRRPKPPSLKEQALMALEDGDTGPGASLTSNEVGLIRRALEALPDD